MKKRLLLSLLLCLFLSLMLDGCAASDPLTDPLYLTDVYVAHELEIGTTHTVVFTELGTMKPARMTDAEAPNDSIYYSTTKNKLVYKDDTGVVNILY